MKFYGITFRTARNGEFRAKVQFLGVQTLAAECLQKNYFVDHHVTAILFRLRKDVFYHSLSVSITGQRFLTKPKRHLPLEMNGDPEISEKAETYPSTHVSSEKRSTVSDRGVVL